MEFTTDHLAALLHLLEEQPESRARLRLLLLPDGLETLPARFDRLTEIVERLAEAQERTEVRLERLAEAQERTEEQLQRLVTWQHGESGRRAGERYERRIARRAQILFNGGQGGPPEQPAVQDRLSTSVRSLSAADVLLEEEADPFLADLIWWKDDHFVVVETSLQVDSRYVVRAARRAETIQQAAGVEAVAMVVGEGWDEPDTQFQAEARGVEWWVGNDLSQGLIAFRRLTS